MVSLSIFFPCHDEEENVERTARRALEVGERLGIDHEVIVVDDGSDDRTRAIADRLAEEEPRLRVVHHERNRGYGAALTSGFRAATKEWVFYTDGDGQFDIGELPALIELAEGHDIVSCFRLDRQDPPLRKLNAWGWNLLVTRLLGFRVRDVNCAFKLYRREIFDRIRPVSQGALIDAEILARAHHAGYRIVQRGVRHYPRAAGAQSGARPDVILRAFLELFRLRRDIRSNRPG